MTRRKRQFKHVAFEPGERPSADGRRQYEPPPNPHRPIFIGWAILFAITFSLGVYLDLTAENHIVYQQHHELQPLGNAEATHVLFTDPIELKPRQNLQIAASSPVDNSWAWVGGDFINEETGMVEEFELPVEYYHGYEGGEHWTEGGTSDNVSISSLPQGRYTLRLEFQWQDYNQPLPITVTVRQNVANTLHWLLALLAISIVPAYLFMRWAGWLN